MSLRLLLLRVGAEVTDGEVLDLCLQLPLRLALPPSVALCV